MTKSFVLMPGGKLASTGNRFGGEKHCGHDRYSALERRRVLTRVLDREFDREVNELAFNEVDQLESEPASTWTVLEPNSGFRHTTTFVIEGDTELAIRVYAARNGGRHPMKVSCDCGCGPDYYPVEVYGSLRVATASLRCCDVREDRFGALVTKERCARRNPSKWDYHTLEQFLAREDVVVIRDCDITDEERNFPTPRCTSPRDYPEDVQLVAWLFQAEL